MNAITETLMYFHKGGLIMWPLLFCSLAVISIAIERYLYYKTVDSGTAFTESYCSLLSKNDLVQASETAETHSGQCAFIISEAQKAKLHGAALEGFLESQAGLFIAKLRNKLDYLSIIVTLSPLLGLLGTIIGMIGAFSIFNVQAGAPLAITGGIGEALIATATGLCVAIMSLCAHSYFAHRMDNMITNMEQCFSALIEAEKRGMAK